MNPLQRQYTDTDILEYSTCYHILANPDKISDSQVRLHYAKRLQEVLGDELEPFLSAVLASQKESILYLLKNNEKEA